jgi:thiol-disulfide isomerase/thioredoxin
MSVLDSLKNIFSHNGYKNTILMVIIFLIFVVASIYTYRRYVSKKINPEYVANSEFVPESTTKQSGGDVAVAELYFFHTTWCPHCKKSMPIWQSLKSEFDNKEFKGTTINFIEVDCDKDTALAEKFNIQGYPTIKLVKGNQVIEYDAKPSKDTLMEFLETSL